MTYMHNKNPTRKIGLMGLIRGSVTPLLRPFGPIFGWWTPCVDFWVFALCFVSLACHMVPWIHMPTYDFIGSVFSVGHGL